MIVNRDGWIIRSVNKTRDFKKKTHLALYKAWRNKVVHLIRVSKKKFYAIEENKKHPNILWKHLKNVCAKNKQDTSHSIK